MREGQKQTRKTTQAATAETWAEEASALGQGYRDGSGEKSLDLSWSWKVKRTGLDHTLEFRCETKRKVRDAVNILGME